jgi:hypothetical protein
MGGGSGKAEEAEQDGLDERGDSLARAARTATFIVACWLVGLVRE